MNFLYGTSRVVSFVRRAVIHGRWFSLVNCSESVIGYPFVNENML